MNLKRLSIRRDGRGHSWRVRAVCQDQLPLPLPLWQHEPSLDLRAVSRAVPLGKGTWMSESYETSCVTHTSVHYTDDQTWTVEKFRDLAHGCSVSEGRTCLKSKPQSLLGS